MAKPDYAALARALVGTRFRPQGHNIATGLDCLGLVAETFQIVGIRRNYRLRGDHRREIESGLLSWFRKVAKSRCLPGDVLLMRVADDQLHLAVRSGDGFVHADARLGRVVETPGDPLWQVLGAYRRKRAD